MAQAITALRSSPADPFIEYRLVAGSGRGPGLRMALLHIPERPARAVLHPTSAEAVPDSMVRSALGAVRATGHRGPITTPALTPDETPGFRLAGFDEVSSLLLYRMDLQHVHPHADGIPGIHLAKLPRRRRRHGEWIRAALSVDHAAFSVGERFDELSIDEALTATPRRLVRFAFDAVLAANAAADFRIAGSGDELSKHVAGYAITGRAGRRSYLQRLAVLPSHQGRGIASLLCADAISWARAGRAEVLAVNTRVENARAASLYERIGFEPVVGGLVVMGVPSTTELSESGNRQT